MGQAPQGPSHPRLSDLGWVAVRLQDARGEPDASSLRELADGWRAWLAGGDEESELLASVLAAVAGWSGGKLSRTGFEAAINRLWAARLDAIALDSPRPWMLPSCSENGSREVVEAEGAGPYRGSIPAQQRGPDGDRSEPT